MSRRNKTKSVKTQTVHDAARTPGSTQALNSLISHVAVQDAFQNVLARTGYNTPNLMEGTNYLLTRLTQNYPLMNALYRNNWLAAKVVNIVPKDMMKNWIKFTEGVTPEQIKQLTRSERITRLRSSLLEGLCWGRLYGGAAGLMMIEGQEDRLEEPLDLDDILPGDFKGLMIVDRWSGIYPGIELVDDPSNPEYGLPKFYEFRIDQNASASVRVHHSRIVRFIGHYLPYWEQQAEVYWGSSIIEPIFEELKKRDNTSANIALLIFQARLTVLKIKDLDVAITGNNKHAVQDLYNTMQAQNWLMSNQGRQLIGAEDDFQSVQYTFSGLNDIYESFMLDMSGASGIPCMKLFGRSPSGMNSTGEYDMVNYYETVEQEQEAHLRPALEKILPVLCMSTLGHIPDDIEFEFNPIGTPTEKEVADIVKAKSESICEAYERLGLPQRTAFQELKQAGEGTSMYTNITDEIINQASDKIEAPLDLTGMMGEPEFETSDAWNESDHPRDEDGQFTSGGGSSSHVSARMVSSVKRSRSNGGKAGTTSKSMYLWVDIDGKESEIRVSDHWYIKGGEVQSGSAGKYSAAQLNSRDDIAQVSSDRWVSTDGDIYFVQKKPSDAELKKFIEGGKYIEGLNAAKKKERDAEKAHADYLKSPEYKAKVEAEKTLESKKQEEKENRVSSIIAQREEYLKLPNAELRELVKAKTFANWQRSEVKPIAERLGISIPQAQMQWGKELKDSRPWWQLFK